LKLLRHLTDARLLILIFFLIRLYGITNPPLERNHNWRQATTNMYARNFLEVDNNILYSRVDMAGDLSGITAKEFPLFNYLIYLTAEAFGWQHWYGRLISLVVSSFGVWFFYLLIKKYIDAPTNNQQRTTNNQLALPATLILLTSIWFGHSRIIMPDTFSVSLVMMGLWFGLGYLYVPVQPLTPEGEPHGEVRRHLPKWFPFRGQGLRRLALLLFLLLGTAGALSKLPSGFLFSVLLIPFFQKEVPVKRKAGIAAAGAVLLAVCGWWYFRWLPHIVETYGYEHYPMRSLLEGAREIFADLPETAERFYISAMKSYVAFALYLAGAVLLFVKRQRRLMLVFSLLSAVFLGYMFKSGATFYHHNYYIIPFVPVMALVAAYAWAQVPQRWLRTLLLLALAVEGIANQQDAFRIRSSEKPKLELEAIADSLSQRSDLVAFFSEDANPQELYFAHRKGWLSQRPQLLDDSYRRMLGEKGCRLVFINKKDWGDGPLPDEKRVFENEHYLVFSLQKSPGSG
jgi:4-amino-4-deoxy-L-arabinose transferase-like glycosyltransferase